LKLLDPATQFKLMTVPAKADVNVTADSIRAAPTRAIDREVESLSARRLVNTALSL
jgi:hypothetical protein